MVVDGLKALDPKRPIREADIRHARCDVRVVPLGDIERANYRPTFDKKGLDVVALRQK